MQKFISKEIFKEIKSPEEMKALGRSLGQLLLSRKRSLVLMSGPLGAGKTTFVQGLAGALGIDVPVTSPTFVTCLEYQGVVDLSHIDAWRIEAGCFPTEELAEIIDREGVCVIEWWQNLGMNMPEDFLEVAIDYDYDAGEDGRRVTFGLAGIEYGDLLKGLENNDLSNRYGY